jgi:tetratricopeptide (TPR) repeat protein
LTAALTRADDDSDRLMVVGLKEFTTAYQAWDAPGFAKAADRFGQACAEAPEAGTQFYWKGVAEFHRLLQLFGSSAPTSRTEVAKAIQETIHTLTTAVQLNERDAESHALLANVYGISIAANPLRAAWLGPRVLKHQKSALRYGPANPRVQYLTGTSQYHGPESLGGKKEALRHLLKAEELFADEAGQPAGPLEPRWGRSSCLAFIGKTYDALGQRADAGKYFRKALEVNPQNPLAREELAKRKR